MINHHIRKMIIIKASRLLYINMINIVKITNVKD